MKFAQKCNLNYGTLMLTQRHHGLHSKTHENAYIHNVITHKWRNY